MCGIPRLNHHVECRKQSFRVNSSKRVWEYTSETGTPFEVLAIGQQTHRLFFNPRPWPTHNVCIVNAKSISVHLINRYVRIQKRIPTQIIITPNNRILRYTPSQ